MSGADKGDGTSRSGFSSSLSSTAAGLILCSACMYAGNSAVCAGTCGVVLAVCRLAMLGIKQGLVVKRLRCIVRGAAPTRSSCGWRRRLARGWRSAQSKSAKTTRPASSDTVPSSISDCCALLLGFGGADSPWKWQRMAAEKVGQPLRLGDVIQLRHLRSGKFLTKNKHRLGVVDGQGRVVDLDGRVAEGTSAAHFRWVAGVTCKCETRG
eukprot:3439925-Rhodomonas_salina.2